MSIHPSIHSHRPVPLTVHLLAIGAFLTSGCGTCPVEVVHMDRVGPSEETVAELAISGMMCEIACVSKVRKELHALPGVASADIHFASDRETDTAFVAYDPNLVAAEDLIASVQAIGDGMYKVAGAAVVHYAPESLR